MLELEIDVNAKKEKKNKPKSREINFRMFSSSKQKKNPKLFTSRSDLLTSTLFSES